MLAFTSLFVLAASASATTPAVCMDLEIQFQEQARMAAEADQAVRRAEDDVRAHDWMFDNRADLQRDLESLMAERAAVHDLLPTTGMTPELEESLIALAESEADILWHLSRVEHQIAGLQHELIVASMHAEIAFDAAFRAEEHLERCLEDMAEVGGPAIRR